ncbi:uncharacterized protein A4U43_C09F14570 [Asparagus officinalis]|uniref:Histone chaperone domain-containing protein n=1 Tax=Asparagus officinalis TaxID=4686 RepID=A0A5P1E7P1_ASPOF|nr:histone H2A.Z-specific chaperone chz1-like [Asparagus officinalis]ONK58584.1 uncharacterized protein A4U43_C09F14570 [Asparagus officinalis]
MAETKDEQDAQTLDPHSQKRKPDLDCVEQGEPKKPKNPEIDLEEGDDDEDQRQKARVLEKGKGKMVIEEEGGSDSDSDSDSDQDGVEDGDGEDSDFCDDPLAEVDLENILPSRTRRRGPQEPGAYLVNDLDGDDDEDDEDEVVGGDEDDEDSD